MDRAPVASVRRGFSVPELLAVIAIILIVLAILLPAMWHARESAKEVLCKNHQRQIGIGFMAYSKENLNTLPLNTNGNLKGDWLTYAPGATTPDLKWANGPQTGQIFQFVGKNYEVFLCPSLPKGVLGSGKGSNGRFDITAFSAWSAAKTFNISKRSRMNVLGTSGTQWEDIITPMIIEEDPVQLNGPNREGHFANVDVFGQWHHDGGSFAAIDGSSQRVNYPNNVSVQGNHFQSLPRGGLSTTWTNIGPGGPPVGWWNTLN